MDHRARQRRRTTEDIVDAAEQCLLGAAQPVEALTVQQIAAAIGLTPGALYRYFPSRDAIIAAVQLRVITKLAEAIDAATNAVDEGPDRDLGALFAVPAAMIAFARASPHHYGLLSRMLAVPSPIVGDAEAAEVLPSVFATLGRIEALFARARMSGALSAGSDCERVMSVWVAVHGAIQLDKLVRFVDAARAEHTAASALTAMALGWGADPEAVARVCQLFLPVPRS